MPSEAFGVRNYPPPTKMEAGIAPLLTDSSLCQADCMFVVNLKTYRAESSDVSFFKFWLQGSGFIA